MNHQTVVTRLSVLLLSGILSACAHNVSSGTHDASAQLAQTNWQGTYAKTPAGLDVSALNSGFLGLASYDAASGRYEFFDKTTGKSRDDAGVYFVTQDGQKRILISNTKKYHAIVDVTQLDAQMFTYQRKGKVADQTDGDILVEHVPYRQTLTFTQAKPISAQATGKIVSKEAGRSILAATHWQGTVVKDAQGRDVTKENMGFIGLAKYDDKTNRYEFFDKDTQKTRGDFGYYDVLNHNTVRAHVSVGKNYAATLALTELNPQQFTYKRMGKNAQGQDIDVWVEHVPYAGDLSFSF